MCIFSPLLIGNELIIIWIHYIHMVFLCLLVYLIAYLLVINPQNVPPQTNAQILKITDISP